MSGIRARAWSPYFVGVIIGLLQVPAFLVAGAAFSVSSAYATLASVLSYAINPEFGQRPLVDHLLNDPVSWWLVAVAVGSGLGAWVSVSMSRAVPQDESPAPLPRARTWPRLLSGFLGGFLMLLGARIADGCVTGDGLSGLSQLAAGSLIAVLAMFAGGITTAWLFSDWESNA